MQKPEYKMTDRRAKWMPWAVKWWGRIKYWRETDRGDYNKHHTVVTVKVDVV
jgi:hypothetical protein